MSPAPAPLQPPNRRFPHRSMRYRIERPYFVPFDGAMANATRASAIATLRDRFGHADFRKGQWEPDQGGAHEGRDALVVMPTGSGKSVVYQLPALMLKGLTVVVSPLIAAWMKDQQDDARTRTAWMHWQCTRTSRRASRAKRRGRLAKGRERSSISHPSDSRIATSLTGCSRAPCHSLSWTRHTASRARWGHDFRPRLSHALGSVINRLGKPPICPALTATATAEVRADIVRQLGMRDPEVTITGFARPNLRFEIRRTVNSASKDAEVERMLTEGGQRHRLHGHCQAGSRTVARTAQGSLLHWAVPRQDESGRSQAVAGPSSWAASCAR